MDRLQAITAHVADEDFQASFVCPTLIDTWAQYLAGIRPRANPDQRIPPRVRRNIGYRLQLLEFECALLLLNLETKTAFGGSSTLHETVSCMKIHQFAVLANTVLEGIGAHIYRVNETARGNAVNENSVVATGRWQTALADEVLEQAPPTDNSTARLIEKIQAITRWRNRIHLDKVELRHPLHINELTYEDSFIPTYQTFRAVLTALSPQWPEGCCLNEDLQTT